MDEKTNNKLTSKKIVGIEVEPEAVSYSRTALAPAALASVIEPAEKVYAEPEVENESEVEAEPEYEFKEVLNKSNDNNFNDYDDLDAGEEVPMQGSMKNIFGNLQLIQRGIFKTL